MNNKEIKEKWLNHYKEEMKRHRNTIENKKFDKIKEEREYLDKLNYQLEKEKEDQIKKKKELLEEEYKELYSNQIERENKFKEYWLHKANKENVSLDIGHDERLKNMREYNNWLSDKVDKNINNFKSYQTNSKYNKLDELYHEKPKTEQFILNNDTMGQNNPNMVSSPQFKNDFNNDNTNIFNRYKRINFQYENIPSNGNNAYLMEDSKYKDYKNVFYYNKMLVTKESLRLQ